MAECDACAYGEGAVAYEEFRSGEPWPKVFWADTTRNRRITEILTYIIKDKLKMERYEEAEKILNADFIDEYELSELVAAADRPPEMQTGEFIYLLWYVFPDKRPSQDELTLRTYDEILAGKRKSFPRGYFVRCGDVKHKAVICFRHLCEDVLKLDRDGVCKSFCNSQGIKVLQKYKLKIVLDLVFESLFHLVAAAYPDYVGELNRYLNDKRMADPSGKAVRRHGG